jgi:hypothetical protein
MSNFLRSGEGKDLSLTPGQSIAISTITGTVTADVIAGTAKGTNLLSASTSGGTFGPYASGAVIRVVAGEGANVDYDIGAAPVNSYDAMAKLSFNADGSISGITDTSGGAVIGVNQVSKKLLACIPGREISTRFNDVSGLGNNLIVEGGNSGAFTTEGYFTTTASTTGGLNIPQSQIAWNPYTQSLIISFVLKRAVPGSSENVFSIGAAVAGYQGFYLSHRVTTGKLKIVGLKNDGSLVAQNDSTLAFSDGTPRDRVVTVAYDAPTGSWYIWRDGVLSDSFVGAQAPGGANTFTNAVSNAELRIGALAAISGVACVVVAGYGLQVAKYVGSLPVNIGVIAAKLAEVPRLPIAGVDLP